MSASRVLIVEDEESYRDALSFLLGREGFDVLTAETGPDALTQFDAAGADLVLLDLMLPGLSGVDVCRALRQRSSVPVIMLTAKDSEIDKVVGLEIGADEYVTKPFSLRELLARVKALLRLVNRYSEAKQQQPDKIEIGDLIIDLTRHEVTLGGKVLSLTLKEYELLKLLALNANKVLSREYLIEQVWGYDFTGEGRTVDVHIHWLREKIEKDPNHPMRIQTVRGVGYRFERRTRPVEV